MRGRKEQKVFAVHHRALTSGSLSPHTFLDPLQMFTFLTFLPLLLPVALTFSTGCEGNDTKALQTRDIPNC